MATRLWLILERLEERLNRGRYKMCYVMSTDARASLAFRELERNGIPATVSPTEDGPVLRISSKYRQRAERLVPALTAPDYE